MADTTLNAASVVQKWDSTFLSEYVRDNRFNPYMGNASRNGLMPFLIKNELTSAGKIINVPFIPRLKGGGKRAKGRLIGYEEAMQNFNCQVGINWNRNAVTIKAPDEHYTEIDLRNAARMGLRTWASEALRDDMISALMAYDFTSRVKGKVYTDDSEDGLTVLEAYALNSEDTKDAFLAANADRFLFGAAVSNHSANDHSAALLNIDTTNDRLSAGILRLAKERAMEADPHIRPFKTDDAKGEEWFVWFVGNRGFRDLSADSEIRAANKDARPRVVSENPIFNSGDLLFDGVIIRQVPEIPVLTGVGNSTTDVAPSFFCGAQAAAIAWGKKPASNTKSEDDYGFEWGVSITEARGVSKMGFNGKQHGMVTVFHSAPASA